MLTARVIALSVDRPRTTIALVGAITIALGLFLPRMELDTDPKNMLEKTAPVRLANQAIDARFGLHASTIVVGVVSERGIFRPDTLGRLAALTSELAAVPGVAARDVASLATTDNVVARGDVVEVRPSLTGPPASAAEADAIRAEVMGNPLLVDRLVSRDGTTAAIYLPIEAGADGSAVADAIRAVIARLAMPERVYVAGDPIISQTLAVEVFRQLGLLSPIAGVLMFVALLLMFRSVPIVLAAMVISMISTVWAMGLHVALGYTVHMMSAMVPVFLMAIATDAIHIFNEVGFRLRDGGDKRQAILATMAVVSRPVIFSDLTTAAGFAALATSSFPIIRVFGIFVAVGTVAILALSLTFVPALLALADERRLRAAAVASARRSSGSRVLAALGRFAVARSATVAVLALVLLAGAVLGMTRLRINNNMVDWFKPSSELRTADRALNQRLGGTALGHVIVSGPDGLFSRPEGLGFLAGLESELAGLPRVGKVVSIADAVAHAYGALRGGADPPAQLPGSEEAIAQLLLVIGSGGHPQDVDSLVDYGHGSANVFVQLTTWDVDAMERVVAASERYLASHPIPGVRLQPAGIAYFNVVWNREVLRGMISSFLTGLVMILVLLVWEYRSLTIGVLAFVPLLFSSVLLYGAIGLVGKDFDMPVSVLSTLIFGLADDFAIHFVSRLKQRLTEPGAGGLDDALRWTIERPGLGIVRNAAMFSVTFIVMVFAGFGPYVTVGVFMATIMLLASVVTLLGLPALLRLSPRALGLHELRAVAVGTVTAVLALALLGCGPAHADGAGSPDADEIARRALLATYYPGVDLRARVTMRLTTRSGDVRERQVTMLRKNQGRPGGEQRYFIYFHKPDDVRRTAFLVWKYPDRDDDRWVFLPAIDLVRRIAASDQRSSFVGSDFTYEDVSGRDLAADARRLLRQETIQDADCFVVESTPTAAAVYGRKVSWIDAATFLPRREEYYDRHGKLFKVFTAEAIEAVKGIPTITRRTMKDVATGHQTTVEMTAVDYDVGIADEIFGERFLRRPPGRWID